MAYDSIILEAVIIPVIGILVWVIKSQKDSSDKIVNSVDKLSDTLQTLSESVAYCPNRMSIEKQIKGFIKK